VSLVEKVLSIKHLSYNYHTLAGETKAIEDISFHVNKGEFISIVGPSGCGKSTLLSLIAGLNKPSSGTINFHNHKGKIGYMLQQDHLFEWRNIYQNTLLGLEIKNEKTPHQLAYIDTLLKKYSLEAFKGYKPSQLSGGMRQRAALIRTLALAPEVLLLDEPFSALDYQTRLKVADDMYRIIKEEQKTAILVTHDIAEAVSMADQVIVLTNRPARVKTVINTTFDIKERTPFLTRSTPEFSQYFNQIWKELEICE
jgi:NitT/TauT family transport system ATP-binding protein